MKKQMRIHLDAQRFGGRLIKMIEAAQLTYYRIRDDEYFFCRNQTSATITRTSDNIYAVTGISPITGAYRRTLTTLERAVQDVMDFIGRTQE